MKLQNMYITYKPPTKKVPTLKLSPQRNHFNKYKPGLTVLPDSQSILHIIT